MKILSKYGIQIPFGVVAKTIDEAVAVAGHVQWPIVVKALLPAGGRGKAGDVQRFFDERQLVEKKPAMKAIVIHQYRDQSVFSLEQTATPKPGNSELLIEEGHVGGKIVLSANDG